jgi:hypothetical protein
MRRRIHACHMRRRIHASRLVADSLYFLYPFGGYACGCDALGCATDVWESESVASSHADLIPVAIAVSGAGVVAGAVSLSRPVSVTTHYPLSAQLERRLLLLSENPTDEELAMAPVVISIEA